MDAEGVQIRIPVLGPHPDAVEAQDSGSQRVRDIHKPLWVHQRGCTVDSKMVECQKERLLTILLQTKRRWRLRSASSRLRIWMRTALIHIQIPIGSEGCAFESNHSFQSNHPIVQPFPPLSFHCSNVARLHPCASIADVCNVCARTRTRYSQSSQMQTPLSSLWAAQWAIFTSFASPTSCLCQPSLAGLGRRWMHIQMPHRDGDQDTDVHRGAGPD